MRNRECGFYESSLPPGESLGDVYQFTTRWFSRRVRLPPFALDRTPVTNGQFARFLRDSVWRPARRENVRKHKIDLVELEPVFDFPMVTVEDSRESYSELRLQSLGMCEVESSFWSGRREVKTPRT